MPQRSYVNRALGLSLLIALAAHDWVAIQEGRAADCFWICNVSAGVLALGWLLQRPALCAAGGIWLLPGTVVWLSDVWLAQSSIIPTSYFVHLGGSALALAAPRRFGSPTTGWLWALALLGICLIFSRFFLAAEANVNAAHEIPRGWTVLGNTRLVFVSTASILAVGSAWVIGRGLRWLGRKAA